MLTDRQLADSKKKKLNKMEKKGYGIWKAVAESKRNCIIISFEYSNKCRRVK